MMIAMWVTAVWSFGAGALAMWSLMRWLYDARVRVLRARELAIVSWHEAAEREDDELAAWIAEGMYHDA
jgi:hypothetical protein